MPRVLPGLLVLLAAAPARAGYEPVLRHEVPALEQKRARLFLARPCEVYPAAPGSREPARYRRLLPGDVVRVAPPPRQQVPVFLAAQADDGVVYRIKVECLSRERPGYSYRGKGSFRQFYHGLVRELPRLVERYIQLMERHGFHIPVTDKKSGQLDDDWNRAHDLIEQLKWVRSLMFYMAYSGRSERSVLVREADWITRRGEAFIRGFSGAAEPEVKAELKQIYLLLNRLDSVPGTCGRLWRLQDELSHLGQDDARYRGLEPAHRERLKSEDLVKIQAQIAERRTQLHTTVVEVRTALMALGIKVR